MNVLEVENVIRWFPCTNGCGRIVAFREVALTDDGLQVEPIEHCICRMPAPTLSDFMRDAFTQWYRRSREHEAAEVFRDMAQ